MAEGESSPQHVAKCLGRSPDFRGLRALLDDGSLADFTVELPDGTRLPAHRAILAGVSDVLRAKFIGSFHDSVESRWQPEVGSATAWRWIIRWVYGYDEPLPTEILVEALLLADQFQIQSLTDGILAFPVDDIAEEVVQQILQSWACPEALVLLARRCVPLAVHCAETWRQMWEAQPQNVALFARFLPVLCEMERLQLLCEYLRRCPSGSEVVFPDCLLGAVAWDAFPADVLEAASCDNLDGLTALVGLPLTPSSALRETMRKAIARRCQALECQLQGRERSPVSSCQRDLGDAYLLPLGGDCLKPGPIPLTVPGLFGRLTAMGLGLEVALSSVHSRTPRDETKLFALDTTMYGTSDQSAADPPWIEVFSKDCDIQPTAFGLKHGWSDSHHCKHFVVEALASTASSQEWTVLLSHTDHPLKATGEIFPVSCDTGTTFDRFRVRMIGPNLYGSWHLMVSWFDVFGHFRAKMSYFTGEGCRMAIMDATL